MNFLQATQNRLAEARNNEGGFTLAEQMVSIAILAILIVIALNGLGTLNTAIVNPMISHDNNQDLKPAQVAAGALYNDIEAFARSHPDTPVTKALMTSGGYVNDVPANVVWALHTYGSPASPQRCVIAYLPEDTTDYSSSNPASFDGLYQSRSIWQNCKRLTASGNTVVPNWDSE